MRGSFPNYGSAFAIVGFSEVLLLAGDRHEAELGEVEWEPPWVIADYPSGCGWPSFVSLILLQTSLH